MDVVKIPRMEKQEYDRLIEKGYVCRIAFQGEKYPYIAPFLYVFDGSFMYFLSTKYQVRNRNTSGKVRMFRSRLRNIQKTFRPIPLLRFRDISRK